MLFRSLDSAGELEDLLRFLHEQGNLRRRENEKESLSLSLKLVYSARFSNQDVIDLTAALKNCSRSLQLEEMDWSGGDRSRTRPPIGPPPTPQSTHALLKCMGRNLQKLHWLKPAAVFPGNHVLHLATLVGNAKHLTDLVCLDTKFAGTKNCYRSLARALEDHPSLARVNFPGSYIVPAYQTDSNTLFAILQAFLSMPQLKVLDVACWIPPLDAGLPLTGCIGCSPNLTTLHVPSLYPDPQSRNAFCDQIQELVHTNDTLKALHVSFHFLEEQDRLVAILQALKTNPRSSLQNLRFSCATDQGIGQELKEAMASLLESNWNLTELSFKGGRSRRGRGTETELKFYLKANRLGRKALLHEESSEEDWIEALARASSDVSVLFYFLSLRPNLCDL